MDTHDLYENPLSFRYGSREMNANWSPGKKFRTWRRLWLALARAQARLGLPVTGEQIAQMEAHLDDINYEVAEAREKEVRHDVMSHVYAFGVQCPAARPIIHLGATSCFVTDNTELILIRDGLRILRGKLLVLVRRLREFAWKFRAMPTLGFTHFQPAQPTTVGKRACLWTYDLLLDLEELDRWIARLPFRGVKGTTGTQASFLELFNGDETKVEELDRLVAEAMGFPRRVPVSGQTYTRKFDYRVLAALSGLAQSAAKAATDIRLLAHLKEVEEPFGRNQIGSSAMAYKRNPMRCERVCSLARFVISLADNAAHTHAAQWMERTLDDSANRRLSLPQAFLGADVICSTLANVAAGLHVWPEVVRRHLNEELPFMATETVIMACVKAGGDRQEVHEAVRRHAMEAARRVKEEGVPNDLFERLARDPIFAPVADRLADLLDPAGFIGRAPSQVRTFLEECVDPVLESAGPEAGVEEVEI
ncbi:MAG: adenylosuccinate lyase [Kiritimatiellaeota bacterium]|nr:adenylosuccinate lyase [Kiritimatiellota bacterium]